LAGIAGQNGTQDGPAQTATFSNPTGIAVDAAGNVYAMDGWSQTLRKLGPDGVVTTLAGAAWQADNADGQGAAARLKGPGHLAVDAAGNVYLTDNNSAIRQITPLGLVTTWAGVTGPAGAQDGPGAHARFSFPNGIAVDGSGTVFVADQDNNTVCKISAAGVVSTLAGTAGVWGSADGTGPDAQFGGPGGLAIDDKGNVYVSEFSNHTVRKITAAGFVTTLAGAAGQPGDADGPGAEARFNGPNNLAVDKQGYIYVTDYNNHRIRRISAAGVVSTVAGSGQPGAADGTGGMAQFNGPNSLAIDADGNLLVTESANNTVRKITPAGAVSTVAGNAGVQGSADGSGAAARFSYPWGITLGANGDAYVADAGNNAIRRISPAGVVTTLAGGAGSYANQTGALPAKLAYPIGIAADPSSDRLYLTLPDAVLVISGR
ncbi:MAG: hypothetical protein EOP39_14330, partial [Rubrivivax sp.]